MSHNPPRRDRRAIITLWDAYDERRRLWAFCCVCGRSKVFSPDVLGERFGLQKTINEVSSYFRCTNCGTFGGTYLIPEGLARFYLTTRMQRKGRPHRTPTLRDLNARQTWTIVCENSACSHFRRLSPYEMRDMKERYGLDAPLAELGKRLRCTECKQKGAKIANGG